MKKINRILSVIALCALTLSFHSCKDYLTEQAPGTTAVEDFFNSTAAATQGVTACYVPLMWEYNSTYCSEWFIGDIASDDALKGGQNTSDMADAYDIENWRTTSLNTLLLDFYRAQYQGIARSNLAIQYISAMEVGIDNSFTQAMKNRLLGEAYFLRAYYYFRLVRVFAGVPITTSVIDKTDDWGIERASVDSVYKQILADLTQAEELLPVRSSNLYTDADLGRATKGAAQAMLLKVNLYMASKYWSAQVSKSQSDCYADAVAWGKKVIESGEYHLCSNYEDNFTVAGENGPESVFEIQYEEVAWGDYGEGFGFTAGSFTQILTRSRSSLIGGGWGFNHPTQSLYDEFETDDSIRLATTILVPDPALMENASEETYAGNTYLNNKYGMYRDPAEVGGGLGKWSLHASRGPLNNKQIRLADVYLMYAEACLGVGDAGTGKLYVDSVRTRVHLPELAVLDDAALRHERRCELGMEGHRWFDLVRWEGVDGNGLKAHMDAYALTETDEARSYMQTFVAGKHEIFPIPNEEIQLNPTHMEQNPGY